MNFPLRIWLLPLLVAHLASPIGHAVAHPPRPNVILIVLDDMNGYAVRREYPAIQMPNLDRFREQAVNFVNAACGVSVCNPSRACFLSGLNAHHTGAYLNGADIWDKPGSVAERLQSLPEYFKANGYTTWGGGKLFHSPLPRERLAAMFEVEAKANNGFGPRPNPAHTELAPGVQPWVGPDTDFPDVENANQAVEFLGRPHDKPFFMFYGLWRPHQPYTAPKRFFDLYEDTKFDLPAGWKPDDLADVPEEGRRLTDGLRKAQVDGRIDETLWKKYLRGYCANSSFADWNIGRVVAALDRTPHAANTLVVICSDNGYHCGEKRRWEKGTLWEMSGYVPLLVRAPGCTPGVSTRTVGLVDLYPTLQDACGLPAPAHALDGRSFAPLLRVPAAPWDRPSLTIYGKGNASIRDERYRYIRYFDGTEELYDHATDPHEFINLAAQPAMQPVITRLSKHLPASWVPSWGGRWEVPRAGEPPRSAPEYKLPAGYQPSSKT